MLVEHWMDAYQLPAIKAPAKERSFARAFCEITAIIFAVSAAINVVGHSVFWLIDWLVSKL